MLAAGLFIPKIHHRRSIRLKGYDYSKPGRYYITLSIKNRECLLGKINNGCMELDGHGKEVEKSWKWLEQQYEHISLGEYIIMPNHMHGIIIINDDGRGVSRNTSTRKPLGRIIGAFKTITTKNINQLRETPGNKLWQRDFYEHIIRNDQDYSRICQYIRDNLKNW